MVLGLCNVRMYIHGTYVKTIPHNVFKYKRWVTTPLPPHCSSINCHNYMIASTKKNWFQSQSQPQTQTLCTSSTSVKLCFKRFRTESKGSKCNDNVINRLIVARGHSHSTCSGDLNTIDVTKTPICTLSSKRKLDDHSTHCKHTHTHTHS